MSRRLQQAAPISADRLASRRDHFMSEITRAPELAPIRPPRRRTRLVVAAVTVAALTTAVSVYANTGGGPTGHGPAAFAFEKLPDGPVRIRIVDTEVSAQEMTQQLHAQGLNISVVTIPASPQVVGDWVEATFTGGSDPADEQAVSEQMAGDAPAVTIPPGLFRRGVTLTIGRAPRRGEAWTVGGVRNALRPGGPLYCLHLAGASPAAAEEALTAAGYTVHFTAHQWRVPIVGTPTGRVTSAWLWDPMLGGIGAGTSTDIFVQIMDPNSTTYQANLHYQWPASTADYPAC